MKKVSKAEIKLEKFEPELVSSSNVSLLVAVKFSRSIKVRLYLNESQKYICENSFGIDRFVFNRALALKKNRWEEFQENLHWTEISKMFTLMKKSDKYNFLNIASRSVIEQSLQKLDRAYVNFFKNGSGFPKFKKLGKSENSFVLTDPSTIVGDSHIKLPKLGTVKIRGLRKFDGRIKNVTVKKNPSDQYFATFSIEDVEKKIRIPSSNTGLSEFNEDGTVIRKKSISLDVNLENFLTDSRKGRIENPRFKLAFINQIKFYQREMAKLFRKTSRDPESNLPRNQSRQYREMKKKLARLFQKITNRKSDFLHKLSNHYVKNHDRIVVEALQILNMLKNHNLAEAIAMVSWGEFFRQLEYKSKWNDVEYERVAPHYTSKMCSTCGEINSELKLKDRTWKCLRCGSHHVRDENAAINILAKADLKKKNSGRGTIRKADGGLVTQVLPCEVSRKTA